MVTTRPKKKKTRHNTTPDKERQIFSNFRDNNRFSGVKIKAKTKQHIPTTNTQNQMFVPENCSKNAPNKRKNTDLASRSKHIQGRSLKGNRTFIEIPKQHTFLNSSNKTQTHKSEQTQNSTALRKTQRVGGPMGRPASLESRSRGPWYRGVNDSPTKGTAPSSAVADKMQDEALTPEIMIRPSAHSSCKH